MHPPWTACHTPPHTPSEVGITARGKAGLCLTRPDSRSPLGFLCLKVEAYLALVLQRFLGSHLPLAYFSLPQRAGWGWG